MSVVSQSSLRNRLLAILPQESLARLQPHLEPLDLPLKMVLVEPDAPSRLPLILRGLDT